MDLQSPSVLAQLPRPLHASKGKTQIGEVYSLAESKKRKRYEVAVAVDGEAVNIYNIQTPKLVTSYAVPPKSSFSCQPCSVRRKVPNKSATKRQTYVAVNPQRQIKSFVEEGGAPGSTAPTITSSSFDVKDSKSPTMFVGIVPTAAGEKEDPFDILAVHKDGRVRRLAADLGSQRWSIQHSAIAKQAATHPVQASFLVEFDDAKRSLLKRRQDLASLAMGDLVGSGVDEPMVLLLVTHPAGAAQMKLGDVQVHMFSVPTAVPSQGSLDESQKLRHLLTASLPDVEGLSPLGSEGPDWDFHAGSAGLNLSFAKGFVNFDISQYTPTVTTKFILEDEEFSSLMRLSPQSVIGAGKSTIAIYDTQYQSIQRSISTDDLRSADSGRTTFIGYYAKLGIAVATRGNTLLAFDLSSSQIPSGSSLKRPRDGLLIDAIGRGIGSPATQWQVSKKHRTEDLRWLCLPPDQADQWNKLTQELRQAAQAHDAAAFDRAVVGYFGDDSVLPSPPQYVNPELTLFLVSLLFSLRDGEPPALAVDLWPAQTTQWLIALGHLSQDNVAMALRRALKPRILPALPAGSFVHALIASDSSSSSSPSLRRLIDVLQGPIVFPADELAHALKTVLNLARSRPLSDEDTEEESRSVRAIFEALNTTLQNLHCHPSAARTGALRTTLSRADLLAMIHHLRISLATGGYTTRFSEAPPTPLTAGQTTPALSLSAITDLLNAAVDAIGPSGWISAVDDDAGVSSAAAEVDLIADLKSEISAALAGVEEASYLSGILRPYLRFAESVRQTKTSPAGGAGDAAASSAAAAAAAALVRHDTLNGAQLMVFETGVNGEEGEGAGRMLPLSQKAASTEVSRTKVERSTGEVRTRSNREMGYLRRKAAGKYSFERLVV
ncbi:uncharacterized protein BDW47DRAFT_132431 [Aspergillus candidus]|uniref:Utp8 beta-propeller domain-containing protein n=1 Tax=Aspergillus candidus TaxID=41067 RepID=A0A2I2F8U4_ASPCN|nr:hypothetical protein BDW47DRAFT_132431 [Aspergillus candidus]PLB37047.1 hypothetical protein BDW47DRAFT_132431 [Aspergillus candidus]